MATAQANHNLREAVESFWDADPCGTRYLNGEDGFAAHDQARYGLEPHIAEFAGFASSGGLKVLEIGVGMGADYLQWLKAGALATGVDMSARSVEMGRRRCLQAGLRPDLRVANGEQLPFPDAAFDVVYSYGVMHHSPDVQACVEEARRVLKPGGKLRVMLYHHPSLTGLMLWLRYGAGRGQSVRRSVYEHLESPGTKSFTRAEVRRLMAGFEDVAIEQVFSPGDLLLHKASQRYQSGLYRWVWRLYPRALVRRMAGRWGLFLLVTGKKPEMSASGAVL